MNLNLNFCLSLVVVWLLLLTACDQQHNSPIEIKGVYGSPKPIWDKGYSLNDLGVNAVFVHSGSINQEMIARARAEGLKVYSEFATLNGKDYVDKHPEAWAIDDKGEQVESATWFMGVCPTEPGFRKHRFGQLRDLLTQFELDGIWMDYVHWHAQFEEPEPILPETCFCENCINTFSGDTELEISGSTTSEKAQLILSKYNDPWRDWRCKVIHDWAIEMKSIIKEIRPDALLGLYHCPWDDDEFDGARRRILGLDYDLLKETIDVFSPMVYHGRMGRPPKWVKENIEWFSERLQIKEGAFPKLWPIVQAYNDPKIISPEEFETVMTGGLKGRSSGVMMFTTYALAEDQDKVEVMKKIYTNY